MPVPIILLILLISILIVRGVQKGNMQFTVKKFVLGLILAVVVMINVIMFFIM